MTRALINSSRGREWPLPSDRLALTPARRARIERTIEALLSILDDADGDADLEDGSDDEPALSGFSGSDDDREYDVAELSGVADPDALALCDAYTALGNPLVEAPAV
jgi:hypothetical protein